MDECKICWRKMRCYIISYITCDSKRTKVSLGWNALVVKTQPLWYSRVISRMILESKLQIGNLLSTWIRGGGVFFVPYLQLSYKFVIFFFNLMKKKCLVGAGITQVAGVSSRSPKARRRDSWAGHMFRLWVWSPVGAHTRSNWSTFLSLPLSFLSPR